MTLHAPSNPKVVDARTLLALVPNRDPGDFDVTGSTQVPFDPWFYSHVQGVARYNSYWLITHSARRLKTGLVFVATDTEIVKRIPVGGEQSGKNALNHAGGCQRIGDCLVVPVETIGGPAASRIVFLDIADPACAHVLDMPRIPDRDGQKAGAAGITNISVDGQDIWVVAVYDDGAVDFYRSNGCPFDEIVFEPWFCATADKNLQSFCLVSDVHDKIFAFGFELRGDGDWVTLYAVHPESKKLDRLDSRKFFTHGEYDVHFRWGAGIELTSETMMDVLCTGRVFSAVFLAVEEAKQLGDSARQQEEAALAAGLQPHCHIEQFSPAQFLDIHSKGRAARRASTVPPSAPAERRE